MSTGIASLLVRDPLADDRRWSMGERDAKLPPDICELGHALATVRPTQRVLVTGATGFLGRFLVRELLTRGLTVECLIRAADLSAAEKRLAETLDVMAIVDPNLRSRIHAIAGDTAMPLFGLDADGHRQLSSRIDAIFHAAAEVSWVKPYTQLRRVNVGGTLEVIRFALDDHIKPIVFISSLAVCFTTGGTTPVDENTDMQPWFNAMPLGYAKSKCVAESLMRQATAHGVPVTIIRPGLLAGDSVTGSGNPIDVVATLITTCVAGGQAPDEDWLFDSLPVDYAAHSIVALSLSAHNGLRTFHLRHSRPRHWREMVLWLNLFGYPIQLISVDDWLSRTFTKDIAKKGPLSSYRRFFVNASAPLAGPAPFRTYLSTAQTLVSCEQTRSQLQDLLVTEPLLDTPLLRRYTDDYVRMGRLPLVKTNKVPPAVIENNGGQELSLRQAVAASLSITDATTMRWHQLPFDANSGLLNELSAIRLGANFSMRRYRVESDELTAELDLVVKPKASDKVMHEVLVEIATLCDPLLGQALADMPIALGLTKAHLREPALYASCPPSIAKRMPRCQSVVLDPINEYWSIAMHYLSNAKLIDSVHWKPLDIDAAIDCAADIHAAWYGKEKDLAKLEWIAPAHLTSDHAKLDTVWARFSTFSASYFEQWVDASLIHTHQRLIAGSAARRRRIQQHRQTLIHHDFNPRNLAFCSEGVCAFDWELATIGLPQRDLAELLCFTWPTDAGLAELEQWLEKHRKQLSSQALVDIDAEDWRTGFKLALENVLVERLPFYVMAHRFRPQPFLPATVRNWNRLNSITQHF